MCQDYLPRCTSQIFLPCKPNKSFWVYDKYASHLFWAGIVQYLLTCSTLISYGLVLYGIYWHILHSTHLLWAGIVWYLLKCTTLLISSGLVLDSIYWCTTLYSSLLGWYCTVFSGVLHSTHLFWAGIVQYLLICTTLYSSLLGWYCTVFTEVYYTLVISSGLVLYSIYWSVLHYTHLFWAGYLLTCIALISSGLVCTKVFRMI